MRRGTTVGDGRPDDATKHAARRADGRLGAARPRDRESTVTDVVAARARRRRRSSTKRGRAPARRHHASTIHQGEILGIAGVEGNGQAELVETIMGMRQRDSGTILLGDKDITDWDTRQRREAGVGYIPEDRHRHGLLLDAPALGEPRARPPDPRPPSVGALIDREARGATPSGSSSEYDVRTPSINTIARALSGGNQQKLIVGREMSGDPVLLIASHPTRGVDVGAQAAIWDHIKRRPPRRPGGAADLRRPRRADRPLRPDRGHPARRAGRRRSTRPTVTPQELGAAMTGATRTRPMTADVGSCAGRRPCSHR